MWNISCSDAFGNCLSAARKKKINQFRCQDTLTNSGFMAWQNRNKGIAQGMETPTPARHRVWFSPASALHREQLLSHGVSRGTRLNSALAFPQGSPVTGQLRNPSICSVLHFAAASLGPTEHLSGHGHCGCVWEGHRGSVLVQTTVRGEK